MEEREIILDQILKVLKDIEMNTCDKEVVPYTILVDKKLERLIELHEKEIALLKMLTNGRCTCGKHKDKCGKKEHKKEKHKKED